MIDGDGSSQVSASERNCFSLRRKSTVTECRWDSIIETGPHETSQTTSKNCHKIPYFARGAKHGAEQFRDQRLLVVGSRDGRCLNI